MISLQEMKNLCIARLEDAKVLFNNSRYDGAFYVCGYVVEVALKISICQTLGWSGYPSIKKEFDGLSSFKTHDLEILLHLSGRETEIKEKHLSEWSVVVSWDPEIRYSAQNSTHQKVELMLNSSTQLMKILCK